MEGSECKLSLGGRAYRLATLDTVGGCEGSSTPYGAKILPYHRLCDKAQLFMSPQ